MPKKSRPKKPVAKTKQHKDVAPPIELIELISANEVHELRAQAAATKAWTALAYEQLRKALGVTPMPFPFRPTLGRILEQIEELVRDREAAMTVTARWCNVAHGWLCAALGHDALEEIKTIGHDPSLPMVARLIEETISERKRIRELVDMSNEQILQLVDRVYEETKSQSTPKRTGEVFDKLELDNSLVGSLARRLAEQADAIENASRPSLIHSGRLQPTMWCAVDRHRYSVLEACAQLNSVHTGASEVPGILDGYRRLISWLGWRVEEGWVDSTKPDLEPTEATIRKLARRVVVDSTTWLSRLAEQADAPLPPSGGSLPHESSDDHW